MSLLATLNPLGFYKNFLAAHDQLYVIMQDPAMQNLCKKGLVIKADICNVIVLTRISRIIEALDFIDKLKSNTVDLDFLHTCYIERHKQLKHDDTVSPIFYEGIFSRGKGIDEEYKETVLFFHKNIRWILKDRFCFQSVFLKTQFHSLLLKDTQIVHYPLLNNSKQAFIQKYASCKVKCFLTLTFMGEFFLKPI
jgi:hypothetical protein